MSVYDYIVIGWLALLTLRSVVHQGMMRAVVKRLKRAGK